MKASNPFKGKIEILKSNAKKTLISFDLPKEDPKMTETFMAKFKEFKFSNEEKRKLTINNRKELSCYQHANIKMISEYAQEFIQKLNDDSRKTIHVSASEFGAFICLAAITSGKLPQDKKIIFELSSCPVAAFPKKLVKAKKKLETVDVKFDQHDSWVGNFESLTQMPGHISNIVEKAAA